MSAIAPPPALDESQRRALGSLFGTLARARLVLVPLVGLLPAWLVFRDAAGWRTVLVLVIFLSLAIVSALELWRYRRGGLRPRSFEFNLVVNSVAVTGVMLATGGVESPIAAVLPFFGLLGATLGSRRWPVYFLVILTCMIAMTVAEALGFGPGMPTLLGRVPRATMLWTRLGVLIALSLGGYQIGLRLRRAVDAILAESVAAREEALRTYLDQSRTITTLSAEIAHELKNPLTSVKGLAALLHRGDGLSPRQEEHLAVLRREVDRMQGVLEEFLNYSRPLVPLTQAPCDLHELCADVAALHDGVAIERNVVVRVLASGPAVAVCDRRKVKQVLINLVQNALEASPPGSEVSLEARADGTMARVQVRDQGEGIPPGVGARVFEPGVTSKPRGSGLGLTVARALARQHGGDVVLRARDEGGCVAELTLPTDGAVPS